MITWTMIAWRTGLLTIGVLVATGSPPTTLADDDDPCHAPTPAELAAAHTGRPASAATPARLGLTQQLAIVEQHVKRLRDHDRRDSLAIALSIGAALYNMLGTPVRAEEVARAALAIARTGSDRATEVRARAVLGEALQGRGRHDDALAQYDSALALAQPPALAPARGRLCGDLGIAYHELGRLDRARDYMAKAREIHTALRDSAGLATTLNNLGRLYQTVGRPADALASLRRALAMREQLRDSVGQGATLDNIGYAFDLVGMPDSALAQYRAAFARLPAEQSSLRGLTLINAGRAYLALHQPLVARDDVQAGRRLKERAGDAAGVSWAQHDIGRALLALDDARAGLVQLDSARRAMHALGDRVREGSALYYLGLGHHDIGGDAALREAVGYYALASDARAAVGRRAGSDGDRVMYAEQDRNLSANWALAWLALDHGTNADTVARESLMAAERGRARALLDMLWASDVTGGAGAGLDLADAGATAAPPGIEAMLAPLRDRSTAGLSYLVTPNALISWLILPSGEVRVACQRVSRQWLETVVRAMRGHVWAETPTADSVTLRAVMLDNAPRVLPALCTDAPPDASTFVEAGLDSILGTLARVLVPPALRAQLPASGELVILPHSVLGLVPFAALPIDRALTPLGARYALRYAPSLGLLAMLARDTMSAAASGRRFDGDSIVIVANPSMPIDPEAGEAFGPLDLTGRTGAWLARRWGTTALADTLATKQAVLARMATPKLLVHFGTHGRAYGDEARASESFIALAPAAADSGRLTMRDVLALGAVRAHLVVLSACETGLGDVKDAEGTVGLQRAFLAKGTRSMLVSLWKVNEATTDALMRAFYHYWLDEHRSKAESLRKAQDDVRRARASGSSNPHYWAGFQLVGAP